MPKIKHRREPAVRDDMQRRGGSGRPAEEQRASRPKTRKAKIAPASVDHSPEQFEQLKRERDEALEQLAATSEVSKGHQLVVGRSNQKFGRSDLQIILSVPNA